jgi:type II secretory pathway pseudopilin PulG
LIVVLALVGGLAVLVAGAALGRSAGAERRRALGGVVAELATARIEAMRRGAAAVAEVRCGEGAVWFEAGSRRAEWPAKGLTLSDEAGRVLLPARVRFEASGRCDARRWDVHRVAPESGGGSGGRIAWIEFDPISGAVRLGGLQGEKGPRAGVTEVVR